jgi:hypothetical protein
LLQGKQPFDGHGWDRRLSARRKGSENEMKEKIARSPAIAIPIPREVGYPNIIGSLPKFRSNIRYVDSSVESCNSMTGTYV